MMTENVRQGDEAGEEPGSVPAAIATEAEKGYGFLVIGREPASEESVFHDQITASTREFSGPFAITIVRGIDRADSAGPPLNILVPVAGTATSRRGAELAVTLAQAARGTLTAPHFTPRTRGVSTARSWRRNVGAAIAPTSGADAVIREIVRLGDLYGVAVNGGTTRGPWFAPPRPQRAQASRRIARLVLATAAVCRGYDFQCIKSRRRQRREGAALGGGRRGRFSCGIPLAETIIGNPRVYEWHRSLRYMIALRLIGRGIV